MYNVLENNHLYCKQIVNNLFPAILMVANGNKYGGSHQSLSGEPIINNIAVIVYYKITN